MKVLQIINSLGTGGAEKLLLDSLPRYIEKGVQMDILLLWNNNHAFFEELQKKNICNVFVLKNSSNVKSVYNPLHILKIRKFLKNYDIAHVHLFPAQYFAVLAKMFTKTQCKLVFTEHNTNNRRINNRLFYWIENKIYARYQKVVCITQEIQQKYAEYLPSHKTKLVVINNGIDLEKIAQAQPLSLDCLDNQIPENSKIIVQVSAFRPQKDQQTLIKALTMLPENIVLVLVGTGETMLACKNLVTALQLDHRVFFLGQRMDVPQILKKATIVVLSSHYEGLSLASVEGMASGVPFIASNVPGIKEIVINAGVLFEPKNEKELATLILELLNDKEYYDKITLQCLQRAKQFSIDKMIESYIDLYNDMYYE